MRRTAIAGDLLLLLTSVTAALALVRSVVLEARLDDLATWDDEDDDLDDYADLLAEEDDDDLLP